MKKFLFSSAILATIALFTACGDDVTEVTEVNEIHQEGIAVLDAGLELSKQKCDSANAGEMLFVTDSAMVFMCDGGTWVSLKGADGENGKNGVDGKPGETGEPGTDGADGDDGEGCEISREGNVLTITCGKSIETIDLDKLIQISSSSSSVIASSSGAKQSSSSEESNSSEESSSSEEESSSSEEESSSSEEESSSFVNESSSSVVFPEGVMSAGYYKTNCPEGHNCVEAASSTYLNSGITYGEILDIRDYQVYKVVTIGAQTWMAQNLNFENGGICYGDSLDNCDTYGRLYTWYAAMSACPEGWHLPSKKDWEDLFENVGGRVVAGSKLKSKNGWNGSGSREDSYGFAVLPAGGRYYGGGFRKVGSIAYFWSLTEDVGYYACSDVVIYYNFSGVGEYSDIEDLAFSVRCLKG